MYNDFLATLLGPEENKPESSFRKEALDNLGLNSDYEFVRYGLPSGTLKWKDEIADLLPLTRTCKELGWDAVNISHLKEKTRKHIARLRVNLDFWEQFSKHKVFSKEEIFCRSIEEGPAFGTFIKKARATCYHAFTAETDTAIEEDEFFEDYDGYNSIIHERYLIHWDVTEDTDDVKYAFIPKGKERNKEFKKIFDDFWKELRLGDVNFDEEIDMIGSIKNTAMYDINKPKKAFIMRDLWDEDINFNDPWYARRAIVHVAPGNVRDTGVGTPSSIAKVKILNSLSRKLSEHIPYSANASAEDCNARYKRVLRSNAFLHLDFKKFGLTFPRYITNCIIRKIAKEARLDLDFLLIDDFHIEIDGTAYKTERGTVLGWLDPINCLGVMAILWNLSVRDDLRYDFVAFNDDVEIGKKVPETEIKETLELLRIAVLSECDFFDIPTSVNKTYGSRASVFLERYVYYDKYGLDMYKEQLTVEAYSKSCLTTHAWAAKLYFSAAEQWTKSSYATERCIDTCPIEFRKDEITLPIWSGGWYIWRDKKLDLSLEKSDRLGVALGIELSKFKAPRYSSPLKKGSGSQAMSKTTNSRAYNSLPSYCAEQKFEGIPKLEEVSDEVYIARLSAEVLCDSFSGKNSFFPERIRSVVMKRQNEIVGPPG